MNVYASRFLLPVSGTPVEDGVVAVDDGRIVAAGPRDVVLGGLDGETEVRELGDAVVLPGLVNAHTHVELSLLGDDPPPGGDYVGWVRSLLERRVDMDPARAEDAASAAIATMVARGTVAVGDVANETWSAKLLARSSLCGVVFHEIYGFRGDDAERLLTEATDRLDALARDADFAAAGDRWRVVLAPHAPHTTSHGLLRATAGRAAASGDVLSIHLAESDAEIALLRDGTGPLPELYRERGMWDESWKPPGHSPVDYLDRLGMLSARTLAVHCVHLNRGDHSKLQSRRVHVVTCPRSNRYLGVGQAPIATLMNEGVPVAIGTDSLASAPDLDLFAEMALLRDEHGIAAAAVLRMATLNGASALGLDDRLGTIEPGKMGNLVVVPLADPEQDPLDAVCGTPETVYALDDAPCA